MSVQTDYLPHHIVSGTIKQKTVQYQSLRSDIAVTSCLCPISPCTEYNTVNFNNDNIPLLCAFGPEIMKNIDLEHV